MAIYLVDLENTGMDGLGGLEDLSKNDRVIIFYGTRTGSIAFDKHVELTKAKAEVAYIKTERVGKNYLDFQLATYLGFLIGSGQERVYYIVSKDKGYDSCIEFWKKTETDRQISITRKESLGRVVLTAAGEAKPQDSAKKPDTGKNAKTKQSAPDKSVKSKTAQSKSAESQSSEKTKSASGQKAAAQQPKPEEESKRTLPESVKKKIRKAVKDEQLKGGSYVRLYDYMLQFSDKQNLNVALVKNFQQEKGNRIYKEILDIFVEYHKQDGQES